MRTVLIALIILVALFVSGCAAVCYVRVGPQKSNRVELILDGHDVDPNIPSGLVGLVKLGVLK